MIDVLIYIMMPTAALSGFSYFAMQKRQAQQALKQQDACAKRINRIKSSFRTTIELYSMQRIVRPQQVNSLCNIVNHYFVDQAITKENTNNLEKLANRISTIIARESCSCRSEHDSLWLQKKVLNFTLKLPNRAESYDQDFYQHKVNGLLRGLTTTRSSYVQRMAA